jgi:hypothetical protein
MLITIKSAAKIQNNNENENKKQKKLQIIFKSL